MTQTGMCIMPIGLFIFVSAPSHGLAYGGLLSWPGLEWHDHCAAADWSVGLDSECRGALDRSSDRHVSRRHRPHAGFQLNPELVRIPNLSRRRLLPLSTGGSRADICPHRSIVDAFFPYSAAGIASATALRSVFACIIPIFAPDLFHNLGWGWGGTLLALVSLVAVPAPLVVSRMSSAPISTLFWHLHAVLARTDDGRCSSMGSGSERGTSLRTKSDC
jgi:hypothetical protein